MHIPEIWKKYIIFHLFPESIFIIESGYQKLFRIILVFLCWDSAFILLLIKWSEMDPNVKPQTLVETFDQANYNSIPEYNVALITLLTYPSCVNMHS